MPAGRRQSRDAQLDFVAAHDLHRNQSPAWGARKDAWERWLRAVSATGFSAAAVIVGALVFGSPRVGLYWIAAGDILGIVAIVLSAWMLIVEILR
jgi:hypothetical protein